MKTSAISMMGAIVLCVGVVGANAAQFTEVRIGDLDGFGYLPAGLSAANGAAADTDGDGTLEPTEFLPDLNGDGITATGQADDFDNRSAAEVADTAISGLGFIDNGTTGSKFTDISLSTSYDLSSTALNVFDSPAGVYGSGGPFPMPPSLTLTNQPGFLFDFFVATGDINPATSVFFNMIFGDYDVTPANVTFTRGNGSTFTQAVSVQPLGQDGLIQQSAATLAFSDVFTATAGGYDGYLGVDFIAPNEPYTAFDVVNLSPTLGISVIPLPAAAWMGLVLLGGMASVGAMRRKFRRA